MEFTEEEIERFVRTVVEDCALGRACVDDAVGALSLFVAALVCGEVDAVDALLQSVPIDESPFH